MPTQQDVQNAILSARSVMAQQGTIIQNNMTSGIGTDGFRFLKRLYIYIQAVTRQYILGDYSSPNFLVVYDCLCKLTGVNTMCNTISPYYQAPNIKFIVPPSAFAPTFLPYTQADVVDNLDGTYYLPLTTKSGIDPTGLTVVSVTSNSVGVIGLQPDYTTSPARIYGFQNNASQNISVGFI